MTADIKDLDSVTWYNVNSSDVIKVPELPNPNELPLLSSAYNRSISLVKMEPAQPITGIYDNIGVPDYRWAGHPYAQDDANGIQFNYYIPFSDEFDPFSLTGYYVNAYYIHCLLYDKSKMYLLDPLASGTSWVNNSRWYKVPLKPTPDNFDSVVISTMYYNKYSRVTAPEGYSWRRFTRRLPPLSFTDFNYPVKAFNSDSRPVLMSFCEVGVGSEESMLVRDKGIWGLNNTRPDDLVTSLRYDSSWAKYYFEWIDDLWLDETNAGPSQVINHTRMQFRHLNVPNAHLSPFDKEAYEIRRIYFGEYLDDLLDSDDEDMVLAKKLLIQVSLPKTKLLVLKYPLEASINLARLYVPLIIHKAFYKKVPGSEDWYYSESKESSTYLEVIEDVIVLSAVLAAIYFVAKFSKKIAQKMLNVWKGKRKLKKLTRHIDSVADRLEDTVDDLKVEINTISDIPTQIRNLRYELFSVMSLNGMNIDLVSNALDNAAEGLLKAGNTRRDRALLVKEASKIL